MNEARAQLSQLAKKKSKPSKWVWYTTVGGEEMLSLAVPYANNAERGAVKSFADFAALQVGENNARELEQQFNEGFWIKDYKILNFRSDLSPKPKPQ